MKKLISLIIMCTLLPALPAFAEDTTMTVEQAVAYAIENSDAFAKTDAQIKAATYTQYQANLTKKKLEKSPYLEDMTIDVYLSYKGYYSQVAKLGLTAANRAKEDLIKSVERDVKNHFYTYLNSVQALQNAEENLKITGERMTAAKQKLDMGTISRLDYENFVLANKGAENSYNQAVRNSEYNLLQLKNTINYPQDKELIPVGEFVYEAKEPTSAQVAIEMSRQGNTYLNLYDNFELAKLKWKHCSGYYTSQEHEHKIEEANYKSAEADFRMNVNSLDMNIRNMYNSLLTMKEQIEYTKGYVDYLKNNADAMYLRYEMGLVTANDWRQTQQEYFQAHNDLESLELSYFVNSLNYEGLFN